MTWYPQDYVWKISKADLAMRANPARGYPGRTYRFYKGPVVFPFGFGLSYTSFTHSLAQAPTKMMLALKNQIPNTNISKLHTNNAIRVLHTNCDSTPSLSLQIDVTNMGKMDGSHTVRVYSTPPMGPSRPRSTLLGSRKSTCRLVRSNELGWIYTFASILVGQMNLGLEESQWVNIYFTLGMISNIRFLFKLI